jgi:hypothetical protein
MNQLKNCLSFIGHWKRKVRCYKTPNSFVGPFTV